MIVPINSYLIGNRIRCSSQDLTQTPPILGFTQDGVLIDPVNVFFTARAPDGTTVIQYQYGVDPTTSIKRVSAGLYVAYFQPTQTGTWLYEFWSTVAGIAAAQGELVILPSAASPGA